MPPFLCQRPLAPVRRAPTYKNWDDRAQEPPKPNKHWLSNFTSTWAPSSWEHEREAPEDQTLLFLRLGCISSCDISRKAQGSLQLSLFELKGKFLWVR